MQWLVTWNPSRYNYRGLLADYFAGKHSGYIKQSKGMAKMVNVPHVGDEVIVSCDKLKILRCRVVMEFQSIDGEMNDEYYIGDVSEQPHAQNNTFLWMRIKEAYQHPERLPGNQKTWVRLAHPDSD